MKIVIKRIYGEEKKESDGDRVLVDRLWPRGISKDKADLTDWWKEVAPSDDLRKWFDHDPEKWTEFRKKYLDELKDHKEKIKEYLGKVDGRKKLTLLYGAKDEKHNQAVVLKEYLDKIQA